MNSTHEDGLKEEKIDSIQNGSAYAEEESSSKIMEKTRSSKIKVTTRIIQYVKKMVTSSQFDLSLGDLSRDLSLNLQEKNLEKASPELQDKESLIIT